MTLTYEDIKNNPKGKFITKRVYGKGEKGLIAVLFISGILSLIGAGIFSSLLANSDGASEDLIASLTGFASILCLSAIILLGTATLAVLLTDKIQIPMDEYLKEKETKKKQITLDGKEYVEK